MKQKILVVDDEADIVELLEYNLERAGFEVVSANDGPTAIELTKKERPDLIILDIMLPSMEGTEVCKILKKDAAAANTPVIMLTAKGEEIDRIEGLELGADDYITKPFSPRELMLRVRAILKRGTPNQEGVKSLKFGSLFIDIDRSKATSDNKPLKLTATEFKILVELAKAKGRVLSRDNILDRVWGIDCYITDRAVDTHIRRLREKLGKAGRYIETVRGFGYRFSEED